MDQRRTHRYKLQLPLQIVQLGDVSVNRLERTRDISSGGVCFLSGSAVDTGGRIEYLITLSGRNPPVRIRCLGKVLRGNKADPDGLFEVALTMERYQFVREERQGATVASAVSA